MSERLVALVDMDGVTANFDNEVLARMAVRFPDIPLLKTRQNFYIADDYPEHLQLVRGLSNEKGFFASLPLAEDAHEGIERILDFGYRPRFCTSPISTNPTCTAEKLAWLEEKFVSKFGKWILEEAIVTKDKYLYDGFALIDDRPTIRNADQATWQHVIYDKEYNKTSEGLRLITFRDPNMQRTLETAADNYTPTAA